MPFPTEFPSEAAMTIGRAVLARRLDLSLLEPAYDLQGYAEYMLVGGAPFPRPTYGAAPDAEVDEDEAARRLVAAAESDPEGRNVRALPIPWAAVLSLALSIVRKILDDRAAR